MKQLELIKVVPAPKPENPYLVKLFAELRAESEEMLAIANKLFKGNWEKLPDVPTEELRQVRSHYNQEKRLPPPAWELPPDDTPPVSPSYKRKPYRPWSEERKIKNRLRLLHERMEKRWSLVEFRQDAIYTEVMRQPQYYGVCPLPGSTDACTIKLPNLAREAAIQHEIMLREIESGRLKPLEIPLELSVEEPELVEVALNNSDRPAMQRLT